MSSFDSFVSTPINRRNFLGFAGAAALLPILAACSDDTPGAGASSAAPTGVLKYWDSQLGTGKYNELSKPIVEGWTDGAMTAQYQVIPTANLFQTFQAAIASNTGPTVSGGYAFQAFQFAGQDAIAYADNLYATMKASGELDDFLPGTTEPFKTDKGYVAVPWGMDMRVLWYRKSLLEKAGVDVPTDWDSFLAAGKALKKIGVVGWATAAGPSASYGGHSLVSLMLNNGGGLFDEEGNVDCLFDRNVEAMDFFREMVAAGMVDPAAVSYANQNLYDSWKNGQAGMGIVNATLTAEAADTQDDLAVMSPLTGPHGDKGTLEYLKNFMMYTNTPSQQGSEDFLAWWLQQFKGEKGFFAQGVTGALPIFKSVVALPQIQANKNVVKVLEEWQPVGRGYAARGTTLFAGLASVDAGTAVNQFTQAMIAGDTDSKTALQTLQNGIKSVLS